MSAQLNHDEARTCKSNCIPQKSEDVIPYSCLYSDKYIYKRSHWYALIHPLPIECLSIPLFILLRRYPQIKWNFRVRDDSHITLSPVNAFRVSYHKIASTQIHLVDGLVQDCSISDALAVEILQFCVKLSKYFFTFVETLWFVVA